MENEVTTVQLTDGIVEQLVCLEGQAHREVFDTHIKGLYVDVQPNGRMAWRLRWYEKVQGKYPKRVMTLGDARVMTVEEARGAARDVLRKRMIGADPKAEVLPGAGPTLETFITQQYLPFVKTYKSSWDTDESVLRNHAIPALGLLPMGQVTVPQVARLVQIMADKGMAPGTINKVLIFLRYAYKLALRWKVEGVTCNPAAEVPNQRNDYKIERYLTLEQMRNLLAAVQRSDNPMLQYIVPFLIYTGARKREALDARWSDIEWRRKSWRIPKTKSGKVRYVPLSTGALEVLTQLKPVPTLGGPRPAEFIFANPRTGKPFEAIFCSWNTARKMAGMPELRIHDLRHSFASFLVNAGRSLYEVQELLGHADIKTTSRYAHLSRDRLAEAVEVVPR
jgi:integrase